MFTGEVSAAFATGLSAAGLFGDGPGAPAAAPVEEPAPAVASRRVLLVDDNQETAAMLAVLLKAAGHEVELAHDGPQALAILERFRPSVAVLDLGLPVMDGYSLAANIQTRLGREGPALIALTGYSHESHRRRSSAAGFSHYLIKPVDLDALLQAIAAAAP